MYSDRFELAFSQFLDCNGYDKVEHYLFSAMRLAFAAGWQAAGGENPRSEHLISTQSNFLETKKESKN